MTGEPPTVAASAPGAVAAGRDIHGGVYISYAGRPPVSWPHRMGVVPPMAAGYQERTDPAVDLTRVLGDSSGAAVLTGVVSGMGGVGKTQLAAAYAHAVWDTRGVDLLVWLTATSRDAIVAGYAQAGADVAHPPEGEGTEQVAGRFLAWLAATEKRWLVVLDDLADPADLKGLWPQGKGGRVLVTTRRRDAALVDRGAVFDVDLFTEDEACAYLTCRLDPDGLHPERLAEAGEMADDLGRLPLALAQAGAYVRDRDLSCAAYRRRLAQRRLELVLPLDAAADDYAATVATTWSLSIELADQLTPVGLGRPLLTLAAQMDPNGIPTEVFTSDAVRTHLAATGQEAASRPVDTAPGEVLVEDVQDTLRNLHRLSLITLAPDEAGTRAGTVQVHALVQRATREQTQPVTNAAAARAAADGLLQAWPEQDYRPEHALLAQNLRDNTDALAATAPGPLWSPDAHPVLFRAGQSRRDGGLLTQAVAYCTTLATTAERVLGPDHPDALTSRSNLACAYQDAGQPVEALPLYERTLVDSERILGPDTPGTLASRNNLAAAYRAVGRLQEAVALYERTLVDCQRLQGSSHPSTLTSRSNLAVAYQAAGRLAEAVALLERTLADRERILSPDHPDTLISRGNLSCAYRDAGRLHEALPLFERTLADSERLLGADHPDLRAMRGNLAFAYRDAGRLAEAVPLLERTLTDSERLFGPAHPETLASRSDLAFAYREAGRPAEAVPLLESILADRERLLGADDPSTLSSRSKLLSAYRAAGRLAEALPLYELTVADSERILGADHPGTLASRNNLAFAYRDAGRLAEALALFERTLADTDRILGADHPDTLTTRNNLASAYRAAGRLQEAVVLLKRAVPDTERVLGPAHPQLAVSLYRLGTVEVELGDLAAAAAAFGRAVEVDTAAYGPDHPEVATDLEALASVQEQQGSAEAAGASRARVQHIRHLPQPPGDPAG